MGVKGSCVVVILGGGGADWGTMSKTALEIPFEDVVVHMHEKHAIAHALARSRIYICGVIPKPKSSPILAYVSCPVYAFAAIPSI